MDDITLCKINIDEVLKYLGYKGGNIPKEEIDEIYKISEMAIEVARPKYCYGEYPIEITESGVKVSGTTLFLGGQDIKKHLANSERCVLFAATLGLDVDIFLRQNSHDVKKTLIFDCCASDLVERLCDEFENRLRSEKTAQGLFLTSRFSCGYGDLKIDLQREFVAVLNATRQIGLNVSSSNLLIPTKSVTAILGVGKKQSQKAYSCDICFLKNSCSIRKAGGHCGK
ncbi:MAG: methionine synthase [Oscillospiraceae bacterium]